MKLFSLLQMKYVQFENAIKTYLAETLSKHGVTYGNNTIFGQLMQVLTAASQNIMLYIEDALVEQNKYTAQRKKSIYGLAAQSGYSPSLGKAASVELSVTYIPSNVSELNVLIKNHESLTCTQNGMKYHIILPQESITMSLEKDSSSRFLTAVQGNFEKQTFVSTGGKYYTIHVDYLGNLDDNYIQVKVNNELWEKKDSFYDMMSNAKQWIYKVSPVGGIDIIFGNGAHGMALVNEDYIEVSYLLHDGELGNIYPGEVYFVFNDNLTDLNGSEIDGNTVFNVVPATTDSVTSGTNSETVEQVQMMIGTNSRSLVLASPENYNSILSRFSFCGYNRTWSESGSLIVNSLIMKNYKALLNSKTTYFDLRPEDFKLSNEQKSSILNFINNSGMQLAGVKYNIFDPEICKYAMYIYVKLKKNDMDRERIIRKIKDSVSEFFSNIKSDIFIPKSDITHLLKSEISEIDGVNVYFLSEKNERAIQEKHYTITDYKYNFGQNVYEKITKTVYLYDGENPNLGLDAHGNIYLNSDEQFPVLMGGWDYLNNQGQEVHITDPLIIIFE